MYCINNVLFIASLLILCKLLSVDQIFVRDFVVLAVLSILFSFSVSDMWALIRDQSWKAAYMYNCKRNEINCDAESVSVPRCCRVLATLFNDKFDGCTLEYLIQIYSSNSLLKHHVASHRRLRCVSQWLSLDVLSMHSFIAGSPNDILSYQIRNLGNVSELGRNPVNSGGIAPIRTQFWLVMACTWEANLNCRLSK